jgi:hypothetical protein
MDDCCYDQNVAIIVLEGPKARAKSTAPECVGKEVQFIDESKIILGDSSSTNHVIFYKWIFPDGTIFPTKNAVYTFDSPGIYSVIHIVEDGNGCRDTTVLEVEITQGPTVDLRTTYYWQSIYRVCFEAVVGDQTDGITIDWDWEGDGIIDIKNDTDFSRCHDYRLKELEYKITPTVQITDQNSCQAMDSLELVLMDPSSIDPTNSRKFSIHPIPAHEHVLISAQKDPQGNSKVYISDLRGRLVWQGQLINGKCEWNLNNTDGKQTSSGLYIVTIEGLNSQKLLVIR